MKHLKEKIWRDLEECDNEIEKKGDFTEKELRQVHELAEVYHLLCKIEEHKHGMVHENHHENYSPLLPETHNMY